MQSERAVRWSDLTDVERAEFSRQQPEEGLDPQVAWGAHPVEARWRFYASCLDARIAAASDGVELAVLPLAVDPSHRSQHVRYSRSLKLCVQRKGRFVEKHREGERVGWERRGEEVLIGEALPTDLQDMLVLPEEV